MSKATIQEIDLDIWLSKTENWERFEDIHHSWIQAGVTRWFSFLKEKKSWPLFVLGGFQEDTVLGTIVALWNPVPIECFDTLFEVQRTRYNREERPQGGVWHLIAATVHEEAQGMGLGRILVQQAIEKVKTLSASAKVRTLSPAEGLPSLLQLFEKHCPPSNLSFEEKIQHVVCSWFESNGKPALDILKLHLGAGATLEKILFQSRKDETRSAGITFRFAYSLEEKKRLLQKETYQHWILTRQKKRMDMNLESVEGYFALMTQEESNIFDFCRKER